MVFVIMLIGLLIFVAAFILGKLIGFYVSNEYTLIPQKKVSFGLVIFLSLLFSAFFIIFGFVSFKTFVLDADGIGFSTFRTYLNSSFGLVGFLVGASKAIAYKLLSSRVNDELPDK